MAPAVEVDTACSSRTRVGSASDGEPLRVGLGVALAQASERGRGSASTAAARGVTAVPEARMRWPSRSTVSSCEKIPCVHRSDRYSPVIDAVDDRSLRSDVMQHPVVIIGAGPIGLAAAANAAERGLDFVVLEAGPDAGAAVGEWAHVRLFSAWSRAGRPGRRDACSSRRRLDRTRRRTPTRPAASGASAYLQPLADAARRRRGRSVRYGARVVGVSRAGPRPARRLRPRDATRSPSTSRRPRAASGCSPAPSSTPPAPGPARTRSAPTATPPSASASTPTASPTASPTSPTRPSPPGTPASTSPSPARAPRPRASSSAWPGSPSSDPATRVSWLLRRPSVGDAFGGGDNDQLEQRGALGQRRQGRRRPAGWSPT